MWTNAYGCPGLELSLILTPPNPTGFYKWENRRLTGLSSERYNGRPQSEPQFIQDNPNLDCRNPYHVAKALLYAFVT